MISENASWKDSRKNDLYAELLALVEQREEQAARTGNTIPSSVGEWAVKAKITLDRGPFSFHRHEYLEQPYNDNHVFQVEMKCAQMGQTTRAFLRMFHAALTSSMVGIMYLFPSRAGSSDFSRTRISPLIERNPEALGAHMKDTDSIFLKRMAGTNLYFRGTRSTEGLRSDPCDFVLYDEYDLFPEGIEATAQERLAHSDFRWQHFLSNPTTPDYGIDALFKQTDQHYWLLKCPKCGELTCLEDTFPECLHRGPDGSVIRICMSCRDAALDPAKGEWVAKRPSVIERRGYHYSQLFSQYVEPADILHQYETTRSISAFHNYKLGLPYADAKDRIPLETLFALCGGYENASEDSGPCYIGVDQGTKRLHVVIGKRDPDRILHIGEYLEWEDLDRLMERFRVSVGVVDAMPETRNARAFAERHKGKVFLNYYIGSHKGNPVWNAGKLQVTSNRTESLDASGNDLHRGLIALPARCKEVDEFCLHAHNLAKRLETKEDGSTVYSYVKLGPDHFRHAYNLESMARTKAAISFFGLADLS